MSSALVRLHGDSANPPEITISDFKAIDLECRKEIINCTPEEVLDRIHACQKIINTQKIRLAAMQNTILDWHASATEAERKKIAEHDKKYQVQTIVETSVERKPAVSLTPEEKMIKRMMSAGFSEEVAKKFISESKNANLTPAGSENNG